MCSRPKYLLDINFRIILPSIPNKKGSRQRDVGTGGHQSVAMRYILKGKYIFLDILKYFNPEICYGPYRQVAIVQSRTNQQF